MKSEGAAWALVAAWTAMLAVLAVLWVRSPFIGPGAMFLWWSAPALLLVVLTGLWLDALDVTQVPRGPPVLAAVTVAWVGAALAAWSGIGAEMALDALILRDPTHRALGLALEWLPGVVGLLLSVGGLAAALEARYRIAHGEAGNAATGGSSPEEG